MTAATTTTPAKLSAKKGKRLRVPPDAAYRTQVDAADRALIKAGLTIARSQLLDLNPIARSQLAAEIQEIEDGLKTPGNHPVSVNPSIFKRFHYIARLLGMGRGEFLSAMEASINPTN